MLDHPEFERWRLAAAGARQSAALQATSDLHNWACFLAEQSAQLAMKALLHGLGLGAWGCDLVRLGDSLATASEQPLPRPVSASLRRLSRHYIPARYPDAHPSGPPDAYFGREDVETALADLDSVLAYVDAQWTVLQAASREDEDGEHNHTSTTPA
ncbi:MAG: HEPN domain-containing protein [Gemmatimonadota bacterium]